ncbi:Acetyl esterase/lipase [Methylobacterium sp. ap11]|uniref:alpha/beta hydrolase n=1 Tax=Methylobacterium sp. ap11 TaxID=1761799 RepID=UPI0008AC2810|nr:alpha/beta hydrolase [Methylobacterium sp. ap11]SEP48007.1 Acetyl esterase/lipase [Methylobacterium sp. ap11]
MSPFLRIAVVALAVSPAISPALAQQAAPQPSAATEIQTGGEAFAAQQAAANSKPGPRRRPAETIPVPIEGVSSAAQAMIAAPFPPHFNAEPQSAAEWKDLIERRAALIRAALPAMQEKMAVTVQPAVIGGVKAYIVTPNAIPEANRNRLLVHMHGGGYVFAPGEAALPEALMIAGFGGFKVICVDYRMPPDFPYPAAMDDAMAVWKAAITMADPKNIAILGTSTGGAMTLAMVHRAKQEGLPLPAAIAPGTPWSDITDTGDTYKSNEWVDNILVTWDGWLGRAARLYAAGHDLKDPQLSPIYGDFSRFPPAILTSGTRDLFLSNTVRTHRALKRAGVVAELNIYEGQSHAQYMGNIDAPETREAFNDIARFFDAYLGK